MTEFKSWVVWTSLRTKLVSKATACELAPVCQAVRWALSSQVILHFTKGDLSPVWPRGPFLTSGTLIMTLQRRRFLTCPRRIVELSPNLLNSESVFFK